MKVGSLVTWKVDHVECVLKSKSRNTDLEIGIVFSNKRKEDHDNARDQLRLVGVLWFSGGKENCSWIPESNLEILK